jgi:hypothetical protein
MFNSGRRHQGDLGCIWEKDNTLDLKFIELSENCDFYAIRHWFLKCASAPIFETFFEKEDVKKYIEKEPCGGDSLEIWGVTGDKAMYIYAKMPDKNGLIPISGVAY